MKKVLYRILGIAIILLCAMSAGVYTLMYLAIVGDLIFSGSADEDLVFFALMALPLVVFFYCTWGTQYNVDRIRKLLDHESKD